MKNKPACIVECYGKYCTRIDDCGVRGTYGHLRLSVLQSLVMNVPDSRLRVLFLRAMGLNIGKRCYVGYSVTVDRFFPHLITIGDNVTITDKVSVMTHELKTTRKSQVIIRKGVKIGLNVTILPGVEIGEASIIGAGSVVTDSIPPHSVAYGTPAKVMRTFRDKAFK